MSFHSRPTELDRASSRCPAAANRLGTASTITAGFWKRCTGLWIVLGLFQWLHGSAIAGWTTYRDDELMTYGDFDGDGKSDVAVVDRITGLVRVGYQDGNGALAWSAARSSGISPVSGLASGKFLTTGRDALAVTEASANGVWILDLANRASSLIPKVVTVQSIGLDTLAGLPNSVGVADSLTVGSEENGGWTPSHLELYQFSGGLPQFAFESAFSNRLTRLNPLVLPGLAVSHLMALERNAGVSWSLFARSGSFQAVALVEELPLQAEYLAGRFAGGAAVAFWVPGAASISVYPISVSDGAPVLGGEQIVTFSKPLRSIQVVSQGTVDQWWVVFEPGTESALYDWNGGGAIVERQRWTANQDDSFTAALPLNDGSIVVMSSNHAGGSTSHSVWKRQGSQLVQTSAGPMSSVVSASSSRANLWFYEGEPFVTSQARFAGTRNAGDWTLGVSGLVGNVVASTASDRGASSGLGATSITSVGIPPAGSTHALVNQYRPSISLFSYEPSAVAQADGVRFTPAPGRYVSNVVVSLQPVTFGQSVFFRLGSTQSWTRYLTPVTLSNDTVISAYATPVGGSPRSSLQHASYFLPDRRPAITADPNYNPGAGGGGTGGGTNQPPIDSVHIALSGTLFYERWNANSEPTIWAIDLDGSGDRLVARGHRPRASTGGAWLAMQREGAPIQSRGNVWLRDLSSGAERRVFANNDFVVGHTFSPDGNSLEFDYACGQYAVGLDLGAAPASLGFPNDCYDDAICFSPDGLQAIWHNHNPNSQVAGLWLGDMATRTKQRILNHDLVPGWPSWSPDGQWIAFIRDTAESVPPRNIYVMTPDGSEVHQITGFANAPDGFNERVTWTPDSQGLIAAGSVGGVNGLWVIPLTADRHGCAAPPTRLPTRAGDPVFLVGDWAKPSEEVNPADLALQIFRVGEDAVVSWNSRLGLLETAPTVDGPWTLNATAASPFVERLDAHAQRFYRVRSK